MTRTNVAIIVCGSLTPSQRRQKLTCRTLVNDTILSITATTNEIESGTLEVRKNTTGSLSLERTW